MKLNQLFGTLRSILCWELYYYTVYLLKVLLFVCIFVLCSLWRDKCQDSDIDESTREIRILGRSPIKVNNPWKQVNYHPRILYYVYVQVHTCSTWYMECTVYVHVHVCTCMLLLFLFEFFFSTF